MDGADDWITPAAPAPQSAALAPPAPMAAAPGPVDQGAGGDTVDRPLTIRPTAAATPAPVDDWVTPPAAPAPLSNGILGNSPDDGWLSGAAKGTATGVIRGVSNALAPVDNASSIADAIMAGAESRFSDQSFADTLANIKAQRAANESSASDSTSPGVLGSIGNGLHWLAGATDPRNVLPTSKQIAAPVLSRTGAYDPTTGIGRAAQAGVEAVAGSVGPGVGAAAEGAGAGLILHAAHSMAIPNAAVGAASQGMTDATGNPLYGMAAGLAAPMALNSAARLGQKLPGSVGDYFQGVNDAAIGKKLYGLASNPEAVRDVVAPTDLSSNPSSVTVPRFKPTTGQVTGDLGLLQAENAMKVPGNVTFNARAGQQNSAAQAGLSSIAAGADEMRPSAVLQKQLDTVDQASRQAQDRITAGAQQLAANLGPGETADALGSTIRTKIEAARQQAAKVRSGLYDAVDPDGTLATTSAPIKAATGSIIKAVDPYAEPLSADEKRLFGLAQQMPDVMPYRSLVAFDQNLNSALPDATRAAKMRLGQLKTAVMATLDGTADGQARREAAEVSAGTRDPADTVATRMQHAMPLASGAPAAGSSVFTPSGRQIGVHYGVMDASDLTASHRPDMTPNPDYPANLQPRDRSRAAGDAQVSDIASNLQPERLGASASAAEGAPIVGPDGIVESGNGRVLAIQRAHAQGGPQSQAYRDFLASHGFDAAGMKSPVLVRQRVTDLSPEDRVRFAQEANASPVLAASATERAKTDAGRLSDSSLAQYQGGDVTSAANRPFVRSFLKDVSDKGESGSFAGPDGSLSLDGARRVQNALVHAGYGDSKLVSSLAETGDPDIAAFGNVMADQAGGMAQLRRGIAAGDIHPEADISAPVLEAGRVVQRARAGNMRLADAVAQHDAFNPMSDAAHSVLKAAYGPNLTGRLSRSRMGDYLNDVSGEAMLQSASSRLFGEPLTATQMLRGAQERYVRSTGTSDPLADDRGSYGASAGAAGEARGRPGTGPRGPGGTGASAQGSVVEGPALAPRSDPAAASRLRAAKDSHIDYVSRFVDGPVAQAIAKDSGRFVGDASAVPAMAIRKGDEGYSVARAYLRDSNHAPAVLEAMTDRALAPLRASLTPQGTVNPTAYAKWKRDYAPALRALDEADPGFASRYDSASKATDLMVRAGVLREQALDGYRKEAAAKFLGLNDPSEVQAHVGRIIEDRLGGVTRMRQLVEKLQNDPDALDGLRRAGAAYLSQKFSNAAKESATDEHTLSTKLPKDVAEKRAVLSSLFSEPEVNRIGTVAHVLDLKQRSVDALKNKGNAQTSRDLAGVIKKVGEKAAHGSPLTMAGTLLADHVLHEGFGALIAPENLMGAAFGTGLYALNKLRAHNAHADQAAIQDALMNPERFAHYTARVSPDQAERRGAALSAMIRRQLITQPMIQRTAANRDAFARGGAPKGWRSAEPMSQAQVDREADALVRLADRVMSKMKTDSAVSAALVAARGSQGAMQGAGA